MSRTPADKVMDYTPAYSAGATRFSPTGRRLDDDFLYDFSRIGAPEGEEFGAPPAKKLSMLLRPSFMADYGKTLVWSDWSAIEARVLPWLAASPGAEKVLDIFRTNDKDPKLPDIYKITAGKLLEKPATEVNGKERQAYGKVPVLSLGFGGALGALQAMATNYGVYLDDTVGLRVVKGWREENTWALNFWGKHGRDGSYGIWGAINSAIANPDTIHAAGRVAYVYDKSYMGGTLFCALPCGRLLTYPAIKWEWREVEDKKTKKIEDRYQLTFLKGYGRVAGWYGKFAENITQATAASILRRGLKRMKVSEGWMPVVMHTHDEIVTEAPEDKVKIARERIALQMTMNGDWDEGLPLAVEVTDGTFYSKA